MPAIVSGRRISGVERPAQVGAEAEEGEGLRGGEAVGGGKTLMAKWASDVGVGQKGTSLSTSESGKELGFPSDISSHDGRLKVGLTAETSSVTSGAMIDS